MPRVTYREIAERFTHIDAEFASLRSERSGAFDEVFTTTLTVKLYPWWEHPKVVRAIAEKKRWRIVESAPKPSVAVHAIGALEIRFEPRMLITEWAFIVDHPSTWMHARRFEIVCNSAMSEAQFAALREQLDALLDGWGDAMAFLDRHKTLPPAPFHLGWFSPRLHDAVVAFLTREKIEWYVPWKGEVEPLVALVLDDSDVIVAEDFEIDVPEFVHSDEACVIE